MTPVIDALGVAKTFRIPTVRRDTIREHVLDFLRPRPYEAVDVLRDVTLQVQQGETLGIMGHNGSGKSTLLKILAGIYLPDRGRVRVSAPVTPLLELGVGWNPELDAIDNILLIGTAMGLSLREARSAIGEILAFADLERFANLELKHFSSGMAARLAYSVAFSAVREVLLIDEIFAVGDAAFKLKCEARYLKLARSGHTVIVVSHDPRPVVNFCTRAILLDGGRVVLEDDGLVVARTYLERMGDPRAARLTREVVETLS